MITHEQARAAAKRLIGGALRKDGEVLPEGAAPRFGDVNDDPTPDGDDDFTILTYIGQQRRKDEQSAAQAAVGQDA